MDIDMDMDSNVETEHGYGTRDTEHGYGMPKRNTETECRNGIQGSVLCIQNGKSVSLANHR